MLSYLDMPCGHATRYVHLTLTMGSEANPSMHAGTASKLLTEAAMRFDVKLWTDTLGW